MKNTLIFLLSLLIFPIWILFALSYKKTQQLHIRCVSPINRYSAVGVEEEEEDTDIDDKQALIYAATGFSAEDDNEDAGPNPKTDSDTVKYLDPSGRTILEVKKATISNILNLSTTANPKMLNEIVLTPTQQFQLFTGVYNSKRLPDSEKKPLLSQLNEFFIKNSEDLEDFFLYIGDTPSGLISVKKFPFSEINLTISDGLKEDRFTASHYKDKSLLNSVDNVKKLTVKGYRDLLFTINLYKVFPNLTELFIVFSPKKEPTTIKNLKNVLDKLGKLTSLTVEGIPSDGDATELVNALKEVLAPKIIFSSKINTISIKGDFKNASSIKEILKALPKTVTSLTINDEKVR